MKRYFSDGKSADSVMGQALTVQPSFRQLDVFARNKLVKEIADFVRTKKIAQGDQYGGYVETSPDAEVLAKAIEEEFLK